VGCRRISGCRLVHPHFNLAAPTPAPRPSEPHTGAFPKTTPGSKRPNPATAFAVHCVPAYGWREHAPIVPLMFSSTSEIIWNSSSSVGFCPIASSTCRSSQISIVPDLRSASAAQWVSTGRDGSKGAAGSREPSVTAPGA
jgi:hypothetical protein